MKKKSIQGSKSISRRKFIATGVAASAFTIVPRFVLGGPGYRAQSDMLRVAGIGVGGKGESDIASFAKSGKAIPEPDKTRRPRAEAKETEEVSETKEDKE